MTSTKMYIETYGCSANQAESDIMAGLLSEAGFESANVIEDSDLVIINTCFVKTPTEQKIMNRIRHILKNCPEKRLIIAGCMPEVMSRLLGSIAPRASLVSTHNITRIVEAAERTLREERVIFVGKTAEKKLLSPRVRKNAVVGITEISQGCNGTCSYCCVRLAKGMLHCYSPEDIVEDVTRALDDGCAEVWLTSQDNGAYSFNGLKLPKLLDKICGINRNFRTRIGMMNPDNVIKIMDGLIGIYRNEKIYRFLHLPVQSGSDEVLKKMRRRYTVSDFVETVSKFRKSIPFITLSTDVIVGFPGETDEDFRKTVELIRKIRPDIVNVSKFAPRPGTAAADMPQLDNKMIKKRSAEIAGIARRTALSNNKKWIGWTGKILVSERGTKKNQFIGRNAAYKPVLVESSGNLLGKTVDVEIKGAAITHLVGAVE